MKKTLGKYELVRHLASGGMADVIIARHTGIEGFERHVVVKRIRGEAARDQRFMQMFVEEARLAASLHHTNIVQVHDIGQEDGEYFFAMEYVHGEDLRKLLMHVSDRDQKVPLEHVMTIVMSTAAALHHAHEQRSSDRKPLGIVHRDVSPANILVGFDGNVKVVDFGIAKATQRTADTQVGQMKGKVAYMSPEQCVGQPVDRRSDIFCLGIVLYELVTVRRLFKGANDFLTMASITSGQIPRPSEVRPDIAPELEAIILKALSFKPEDRYQTADEMRLALDQYAAKANLRGSTTALADYMRSLFGDTPVPWLAEDDDDDAELSYDFDGSGSGIAPAPEGFELPSALPAAAGSPIQRARTKAITESPPLTGTPEPIVARSAAPTQSPIDAANAKKKKTLIALGGAGALLLLVIVAFALAGGGSDEPAATAKPAEPARVDPTPPSPQPEPQPQPEPPVAETKPAVVPEPVQVVEPPPATTEVATHTSDAPKTVPKKKKTTTYQPPKRPVKGSWDPNALFPKKK